MLVSKQEPSGDIKEFVSRLGYNHYYGPVTPEYSYFFPSLSRIPGVDILWIKGSVKLDEGVVLKNFENKTYSGR